MGCLGKNKVIYGIYHWCSSSFGQDMTSSNCEISPTVSMHSEVAACASISSQPTSRHLLIPATRSHRRPATGPAQHPPLRRPLPRSDTCKCLKSECSSSSVPNWSFRLPFVPLGRLVPSFGTSWFQHDLGIMISPYDWTSSDIYLKSRRIKRRQKDLRPPSPKKTHHQKTKKT